MTVKEAAARLEISVSLCYTLIGEGRLKCLRIGQAGKRGKVVVRESDVAEFVKKCEASAR
jgi:excisionase family DNA binding protein